MVMGIDEVIRRTTMELPQEIHIREVESILHRIAKDLPAIVNYCKQEYINLEYKRSRAVGCDNRVLDKRLVEHGTASIVGTISSKKNPAAFDSFETQSGMADPSMVASIRFCMVPGWGIGDYRPEVRQLWDDTRKIVDSYFKP